MRFSDPMAHLRSHLSKANLELMRNGALTTAGFAAAIIILLSQTKGTPTYSSISLWAAMLSMVVWLFGFQYISTYLLHGERVYQHINIFVAAAIAVIGYVALFVAIVATVWRLSVCAGVTLIVLGILLAVVSFIHIKSVERQCNESDA